MTAPLYLQIRSGLELQIRSGQLSTGAKLPTEADLQAEHGVSRSVAQRVLNDLAQAGLVVRRKSMGTYVAEGARQINLLGSLDPRLDSAGLPGRLAVISAEVLPAVKVNADLPGMDPDSLVTQLVRVRRDIEDRPIGIEVAAIPFELVPGLLHEEQLEYWSVRAHLKKNRVAVTRSRIFIDPILLERHHAHLLGIEPGVAVLRRRRLMWEGNGQIAESATYYLLPGALEFYIEYSD